jgi:hypothetical protein
MIRAKIWLGLLVGLLVMAPELLARQADAPKAAIALDVDFDGLSGLGFDNLRDSLPPGAMSPGDVEAIKQISRLSVFMAAPDNVQDFGQMSDGQPIPFEIFVRVKFKTVEARGQFIEAMKEGIAEVSENGQKVFKPTEKGPPNLRLRLVGDSGVELGTEKYMASPDKKLFSANLLSSWNASPNHAFKLALDFESASKLISALVKDFGEGAPPPAKPFIALLPKMSTLRLTLDGKDATLLSLSIDGKDEKGATDLQEGLDALLGMARGFADQGIGQMEAGAPKMGAAARAIVGALNSKKAGKTVSLSVPRPEGFNEAIEEAMNSVQESAQVTGTKNRIRFAAIAVHNYHDVFKRFPTEAFKGNPKAGGNHSWRVRILPFIEEMALSEKINMAEDFDSKANAKFAESMPETLGNGSTSLSDIAWVRPPKPLKSFEDITDGMSNTIMLVQLKDGVPWMDPNNITADEVVKLFESLGEGEALLVAFYDGSVRDLSRDLDVKTLKLLLDPTDGQAVDLSELDAANR